MPHVVLSGKTIKEQDFVIEYHFDDDKLIIAEDLMNEDEFCFEKEDLFRLSRLLEFLKEQHFKTFDLFDIHKEGIYPLIYSVDYFENEGGVY